MTYFFEPINLKQWNLFDKVKHVGHVEPFLATKKMKKGDIVLYIKPEHYSHIEKRI